MISESERREIEEIAGRYPLKRASCLQALKIVQKNHAWVSDEDLRAVAAILNMTAEELDGVATFYSQIYRQPVGRHVILVCDSVSCWLLDYETLLDHLRSRLGVEVGGTTADGRFTLLTSVCLGACDRAPVMMIDGTLHGELTPERIDAVLAEYE